jgi:hypothetical protein
MTVFLKNVRRSDKDRRSAGDRRQYNEPQYISRERRRTQERMVDNDRRKVQLFMPEL